MMQIIHRHLGVARMVMNRNRVDIVVSSIDDLLHVIIPHFDKYPPLLTGVFLKKKRSEVN